MRHDAEAAGQADERGIRRRAGAAHLARTHAFLGVMHRADLTGQQARAALLLLVVGGHVLATERQRRGGHIRNLAQEPDTNQPR